MPTVSPNLIIFSFLATISVLAALGVIFSKSAIRSALFLVLNFFVLAVLYFSLNAEMLGITQIVVYAGAIMVLFLFVIMLLATTNAEALDQKVDLQKIVAGLIGLGLAAVVGAIGFAPFVNLVAPVAPNGYGSPQVIGEAIFTKFGYPFEAISILLMVGIVGSILLAKRRIQ